LNDKGSKPEGAEVVAVFVSTHPKLSELTTSLIHLLAILCPDSPAAAGVSMRNQHQQNKFYGGKINRRKG
jgi:hypothetical protein